MEENPHRAEAIRLLGISEKLLQSRDLIGSKDFAILAQESEPLLEGSDQILAVVDVLLAAEKRINNHHDWYSILQLDRRSDDHDVIKKQYRRLALLLNPEKNKFPFADYAFQLVAEAWAVLSSASKKSLYDKEVGFYRKVDLSGNSGDQGAKLPVRKGEQEDRGMQSQNPSSRKASEGNRLSTFWTACPYCYRLFEYQVVYEGCCLRCQNCQRAFHGISIHTLPPLCPEKEAYYCCWSFFPLGLAAGNPAESQKQHGFPNWMPPVFSAAQLEAEFNGDPGSGGVARTAGSMDNVMDISDGSASDLRPKKRGRPRKYPERYD